jgi:biotin carboxylase
MKKILQLGGGLLQMHSITQLKKSGYKVYVADVNPNCPCSNVGDVFICLDISNHLEVSDCVKTNEIDAIIAVNDAGVYPAAYASTVSGLKYISESSALKATNKGLMRDAWKLSGLSQPKFRVVASSNEIESAVAEIGFPCIIKPVLNWGSRGISSVFSKEDLDFAILFAEKHHRNNNYIIEEFIQGIEMTVEGLCKDGVVTILSKSDKVHQQHERYKVAMQLNYPSGFDKEVLEKVDELVKNAARSLELTNCAIHCEVIIRNSDVYLIEMAARPGGGHIFGMIVEAQCGVPYPLALVKIFLSEEFDFSKRFQKGVSYRFFTPPKGIFKSVEGIERLKSEDGVLDIGFSMKPGTKVDFISGDADRPGYLVTQAINKAQAIKLADSVIDRIKFKME